MRDTVTPANTPAETGSLRRIRRATIDDANALSALAERTFRATYTHGYDAGDIDMYVAGNFSATLQESEILDPARITLVVEENGELLAYGQLVRSDVPSFIVAPAIELARIYVLTDRRGTGLGAAMLEALIQEARANRASVLWLRVWAQNASAIRFYERHGFRDVGTMSFQLGRIVEDDRVLARSLS